MQRPAPMRAPRAPMQAPRSRPSSRAAGVVPGTITRPVSPEAAVSVLPASTPAAAPASSGAALPGTATPVAPASDLQTRQLRLLPWQTGSAAAGEDSSAAAARRASGAAASTSGPSRSSKGLVKAERGSRMAAAAGGTAQPDYRPSTQLPSLQDLNLAAPGSLTTPNGSASGGDGSSSSGEEGSPGRRRRRPSGPMSPERREAISRSLKSKGAKSEEHKRSIARAMREAHARNPGLRHSNAGQKKKCGHCGEEGHNKRACPQLKAAAAEAQAAAQAAAAEAEEAARQASLSRVIVIEVDEGGLEAGAHAAADNSPPPTSAAADETLAVHAVAAAAAAEVAGSSTAAMVAASSHEGSSAAAAPALHAVPQPQPQPQQPAEAAPQHPAALPTRQLGPGLELSLDGDFVYPLPASKEQCVAQAAQAVLRAWDDGIRRQGVELLLPQGGQPLEGGGGWPGGIRQQFRAAKPMVEGLLLRLKAHAGLQGRITGELLDEGDCVAAWQSERLGAMLFPTADTLADLRNMDDALSGKRLTVVVNPQWQLQGQVVSDFGIGRARKAAERFVAAFEDVYYLRRVLVFGDDVRILRCYPGQWQVHYVPPAPEGSARAPPPLLLSCEDAKPTFQRLIELLKGVRGSRASKSWLDRWLAAAPAAFATKSSPYSPEGGDDGYSRGGEAGAAAPGAAAPAQPAAAGPDGAVRDIITGQLIAGPAPSGSADGTAAPAAAGEPVVTPASAAVAATVVPPPPGGPMPGNRPRGGSSSQQLGVPAPRDIRLGPVAELSKWLPRD